MYAFAMAISVKQPRYLHILGDPSTSGIFIPQDPVMNLHKKSQHLTSIPHRPLPLPPPLPLPRPPPLPLPRPPPRPRPPFPLGPARS